MSRHTLLRENNGRCKGFIVCGWDRPLKYFFCQVWNRHNTLIESWNDEDLDDLLEAAHHYCGVIPDGLRLQLQQERDGKADTNTIKDWRKP